jgi:hypothetical protein
MKKQLLYFCLSVVLFPALMHAQDTIYHKNTSVIIGKVLEISQDEIKYKRSGMEDGPLFTEKKKNIESIHYSNGTKDVFNATPNIVKAAATTKENVKARYVLTLTDATKLKGTLKKEGNREIVFIDDNLGEQTINRNVIATLEREYGNEDWIIALKDGSKISGKILSKTEDETIVQTKNLGNLKINNEKIRSIDPIDGTIAKTGKVWFKNPTSGLYYLSPTAIPLKKGDGYYHNYYGAGNEFCYALSNHATIGGGLTGPMGVYLTAKVSTSVNEYAHVAGGVFIGNSIFPIIRNSNFGLGLGYAAFTVGNIDHNLTATVCYGFVNSRNSTDLMNQPLMQLSGTVRVSKKLAIVSENWLVSVQGNPFGRSGISSVDSHYEPFISYGCRILNKRGSFDIGFLNTPALWENNYLVGMPYIGFLVRFGKPDADDE